jgi:hypothetical protein
LRMSAPRSPRVSAPRWPAPRPRPKAEGVRPRGAAGPGAGAGEGVGAGHGVVRRARAWPDAGQGAAMCGFGRTVGGRRDEDCRAGRGCDRGRHRLAFRQARERGRRARPPARAGDEDEPRQGGRAAAWHDLASDGAGRAAQRSNGCSRSAGPGSSGR